MLIFYVGSIVISLILVFVGFLLFMGAIKEGNVELKETFSNGYYISALIICLLIVSLIPIVNIICMIAGLYQFIDYYIA